MNIIGWILAVLVGAGAVWLLLFWRSFRRHDATRSAAPAAAPVVPASTPSAVAPPTVTAPAPAPVALPAAPVPTAAAAPAVAATTLGANGLPLPLPQEPIFRKWLWRAVWTIGGLSITCVVCLLILYLASKTEDGGERLWEGIKEYLAIGAPWLLALAAVGLIGWLVRKWWKGRSAAATPATTVTPATTAAAGAGAGAAAGTPATPSAADLKAAREAAFRENVEQEKIRLQKSAARWSRFWKLSTVGILAFGIWAIWIRPQANGLTPSQEYVKSAGVTPQGLAPKRKAKWTCWPEGLNQAIVQHAVIMTDERGTSPRLVVEVEYFNYNYSNARRIVRYSWDGIAKTGTWFDEGTREIGTFTGHYDYASAGSTFFSGEKKEPNGSRSRFIFDRSL